MADPLDNQASGEQLRRLLLREEQDRLDRLEARLGNDDNLKSSLTPIIADVLRDAGVQDYRRLARALAPIVLQSIKTEIHNSRDMMVDALYPITGRLVAAAVRNAFKDLVEQLNQKLDQSLSADRWRARIKGRMTGRSEAEILLSEGAAFEITDLLLINRDTGFLLAKAGPSTDDGDMDSQLLGSILTAIMAFVRDAMRNAPEQDLRTLHVGDLRLHLQVSPGAILAIKTKGPPPAGFDSALNETFCAYLAQWGDTLSDPDEIDKRQEVALADDLDQRFQGLLKAKQSNFRAPSKKGAILLLGLALIALGFIGWHLYGRWQTEGTEAVARAVIDDLPSLTGYPLQVRYGQDDETLTITGLTPHIAALEDLRKRLGETLPEAKLVLDVQALPQQAVDLDRLVSKDELMQTTATLKGGLAAVKDQDLPALDQKTINLARDLSAVDAKAAALDRDLDRVDQKTALLGRDVEAAGQNSADIKAETDALRAAIERVQAVLPDDDERKISAFRNWMDRHQLRFADGSGFENETRTNTVLREVALRLNDLPANVGLLVVGYADDSGVPEANEKVSLRRAEIVSTRLLDLGVSPRRLVTVGRSNENRISLETGQGSANRRVEIELIFLEADLP